MRADVFGNLITNFRSEDLPESAANGGAINLQVGTHQVARLVDTYASGSNGEAIAYVGSSGYIEIGRQQGKRGAHAESGAWCGGNSHQVAASSTRF